MSAYDIPNHKVFELVEVSVQAIDAYLRPGDQEAGIVGVEQDNGSRQR